MKDSCDPASFNAALGPDTCTRNGGGVTFERFIDQLTRFGVARTWFFTPPTANVRPGDTLVAINRGGEAHTFTGVAQFGGGIVPLLNNLSNAGPVAPECQTLAPDDFVAPGDSYRETITEDGPRRFQCCLHPWMKLEARVRSK